MKKFMLIFGLLATQLLGAQSLLKQPNTDCVFMLPWNCETCTFTWSADCIKTKPTGKGILQVYNNEEEIMRYEGEMQYGLFNGKGTYRDGMNQMEGYFQSGQYVGNSPFIANTVSRIDTLSFNKTTEWENHNTVTKQVDNLYFIFPNKGYAYKNRDKLVKECKEAILKNTALIGVPEHKNFTKIRFVESKEEMLLHANLYVGALCDIRSRSVYMVCTDKGENKKPKLPITHELMHMVAMTAWNPPPMSCNWLNEGLATYAANSCSGYTVGEIYRYFLANNMLVSLESLSNNIFDTEEMIGYHQSAYVVQFLLNTYGLSKFEQVWKNGIQSFESVYGFSLKVLEEKVNASSKADYPDVPNINWEVLKEGCR